MRERQPDRQRDRYGGRERVCVLRVKSAVCVGEISPVVKDSVHLQLTH